MRLTALESAIADGRSHALPRARSRAEPTAWQALLLLGLAAVALRAPQFGNPVVQVDEQFYLLVGDRMWHGLLPFVDIWDRKPVGLFLIYGAIRGLGGAGILQYQLVATAFAIATAFVISRMARAIATPWAAIAAGLVYLVWLDMAGGDGGQSPVFYNLFTALAAAIALRIWTSRGVTGRRLTRAGCGAMLLMGVAIQVKYTALFEGVFFGMALLWCGWQRERQAGRFVGNVALWVGCGLLPTAAALLFYVALGHGALFFSANFESFFERADAGGATAVGRLLTIVLVIAPLAALAVAGMWRRGGRIDPARRFVLLWCLAAFGGVLLCGGYYIHYALPLLVPFALATAPALAWPRWGWRLALGLLIAGLIADAAIVSGNVRSRGEGTGVRALVGFIRPRLGGGDLYVYYGDPILYYLTGSPLPTRYPFPSHLNHRNEAPALGVSRDAELRRVLATHPRFIVSATPLPSTVDPRSVAIVQQALGRGYRLVAQVQTGAQRSLLYQAIATSG
ncbi:MAG: hypothetical protein ACTHMG_08535 [Sphingomonas sp.]